MELLLHQVMAGLATGAIYACMALAVVMIYQAIDHLNFAQGEMAMFSTFIAWQLIAWGLPYWAAFAVAVAISFAAGVAMLVVEQNAALALDLADHAYLLETGRIVMDAPAAVVGADESVRRAYLGY